ncbi:hydroxymethylglutaryl-CoA lyase [Aeromicrobium endophyticum]|uniref:Hydroxymethylglutaryl-CoA lyase n=1 Tax=Aeromicrobium endophyticum TaxID=2292704 RepID=A0A371PAM1_9ACTN|nr:hydroxymethylglutaryl-CoA lyase [Aeromicrobium endophyticum]REK72951.1 hydroxymethylglutaryl-CoA lyase [Aeromicrobium endophyticum]
MSVTAWPVLPATHPEAGLPTSVSVYEVGARDGLQAEIGIVATEEKIRFLLALRDAGLRTVEATSFVSPRWVPQLADAAEVLAGLGDDLAPYPVLVPNQRGLERALEAGATAVAVFVSATETFAQRNLNMTRGQALEAAQSVAASALDAGLTVRGYVSMCFGDPWEGRVAPQAVAEVSRSLIDAGAYEVSLGDTIGVGTAGHVRHLVDVHRAHDVPVDSVALHFHDTYGQALANVHAGLQAGVRCFDASAGGIGGCPFAGTATGNLATEDLLWMLTGLGIETGVDLAQVVAAGARMTSLLGKPTQSRVAAALG